MIEQLSIRDSNINACKLLGLNPELVLSINIKLTPDSFPTAYVEMAVTEKQVIEISTLCGVVKKFKPEALRSIPNPPEPIDK